MGCNGNEEVTSMNVIIDTDMGADDWMAALLLFCVPSVQIQAITVTGNGLAHLGFGVQHALDLALLAGRPNTPVAIGTATPLAGDNVFPAMWRTPTDFFQGIPHVANLTPPAPLGAAATLTQLLENAAAPISILALGPLTNVAMALKTTPTLVSKIERIYIMGGAVNVPGNVPNSTAEFNFWTDYLAASIVLSSGVPVTMVPLDATNQAPVTMAVYQQLAANLQTPAAKFVFQTLTAQLDTITQNQYYFWDPLAAAFMVNPAIGQTTPMRLSVMISGQPKINYGSLVPDNAAPPIDVLTSVDAAAMASFFVQMLAGTSAKTGAHPKLGATRAKAKLRTPAS